MLSASPFAALTPTSSAPASPGPWQAATGCFVVGCVGFYWPAWYVPSVSLFLAGSVLFLVGALATALVEHGPSK